MSSFAYRYDRNGNRVEQVETRGGDPAETTTYAYALADRLAGVTYPDRTVTYTYTYDPVGNRRSEIATSTSGDSLAHRTYTYDVRDRLESVAAARDATASVTYTYDPNGNQLRRETGAGAVTDFAFDVLDRMVRVEEQGLPVGTYRYDATGLRVEKLTAHGVSRYLYDQQSVLTREDAGGVTKYDYGPDRLLSVADPVDGRAFYLHDTLGSIVDLTTAAGIHLASYQYDAWGNYVEKRDTDANPFGFTGHEHDEESGLVYAKARFYDPEIGVFLSMDPAEGSAATPPSLHRYLYAYQNPTVYVDPDGRTNLVRGLMRRADELREDLGLSIDQDSTDAEVAKTGITIGLLDVASSGLSGFNWLVNVIAAVTFPDSKVGLEAEAELKRVGEASVQTVPAGW